MHGCFLVHLRACVRVRVYACMCVSVHVRLKNVHANVHVHVLRHVHVSIWMSKACIRHLPGTGSLCAPMELHMSLQGLQPSRPLRAPV